MKISKHRLILQTLLVISLVGSSFMTNHISQFVGCINFNATDGSEWTFMFYLCGDNNLEKYAINIINELESGYDLSKNISILVLIDRISGEDNSNGDFTGARLYEISLDSKSEINSEKLKDYGEIDMGLSSTLQMLINYGFENYSANHYFLSLYNHGAGIYGICFDDTPKSYLQINEIKQSIDSAGLFYNEHIDVLVLAGCLLGEVEIAYELRDSAKYLISSQNFGKGDFTNWQIFLDNINNEVVLTPFDLTNHFIQAFQDDHLLKKDKTTCSVIDLTKLKDLFTHIENFSNNLTLTLFDNKHVTILNAREKSSSFDYRYVDLIDFSKNLLINRTFMNIYPDLELSIEQLIDKTQEAIIFNYQNHGYIGSANGLSLYFLYPYFYDRIFYNYVFDGSSIDLEFTDESSWVTFLKFLYDNDTDQDGLDDWFEFKYKLNYLQNDTDSNGISDSSEDFDLDEVNNLNECGNGANPYKADTDNDKMSDYQELWGNDNSSYPFTWDSDLDDFSDKLEVTVLKTDPKDINDPKIDYEWFVIFALDVPIIAVIFISIAIPVCIIDHKSKKFKDAIRNALRGASKGYEEIEEECQLLNKNCNDANPKEK
ncbi:MAG: clostripain-related cysteine peptidase [Candidatus Heimdallarchaeota archaeon]